MEYSKGCYKNRIGTNIIIGQSFYFSSTSSPSLFLISIYIFEDSVKNQYIDIIDNIEELGFQRGRSGCSIRDNGFEIL